MSDFQVESGERKGVLNGVSGLLKKIYFDGLVVRNPPTLPVFALLAFIVVFAIVLSIVMIAYNQFFQTPLGDLSYWQAIGKYHPKFGSWHDIVNSDPLQGMFDVFPQGYRGSLIFDLIYSLPLAPHWIFALLHGLFALFATLATFLLARSAGVTAGAALLAGIVLPIFTMPVILSKSGVVTHIFALNVNYIYVQSAVLIALALFWSVNGRQDRKFYAGAFLAFLLLADICNAMALHVTLFIPAAVIFGLGGLVASASRAELRAKLVWAALVSGGLIVLGFPNYIQAIGSDLAYRFFFDELNDFSQPWTPQFQHFMHDFYHVISWRGSPAGWPAAAASTLGLASALYYSLFGGRGKFRVFAITFLFLVGLTSVAVFVLHFPVAFFGTMYKGPNAYHLVYAFWPFHAIMIMRALHDCAIASAGRIRANGSGRVAARLSYGLIAVAVLLPLVQLKPLLQQSELTWEVQKNPFDMQIRHNRLTEFLSQEIGLKLGATFRGVYNNFAAFPISENKPTAIVTPPSRIILPNVASYAAYRLFERTGNDLTRHGLWMLGIPTLMQESVTITSQIYLMVAELLTRPEDKHTRSFLIPTLPVDRILNLWGVRYILVDTVPPFGTVRMTQKVEPVENETKLPDPDAFQSPIYLVELENANRGDYSPTEIRPVSTAREIVEAMRDTDFDGRQSVLVTEPLEGAFVPATEARMVVARGGFDLTASSAGDSVLVLPVQFSHCWQVSGQSGVSLFRANLMQLGVRFKGDLAVQVRQVFGPLWNSGCRLLNAEDMERLRLQEARN